MFRSPPGVAGADGCRGGWVAVSRRPGKALTVTVYANADALLQALLPDHCLAVDIPIGLAEQGGRQADTEARRLLGRPRSSSVFTPPTRPLLGAENWQAANAMRRRLEGRGLARQAWGIADKIREMDAAVRRRDPGQARVREAHPELAFAMRAGAPMIHNKKTPAGRAERELLIDGDRGSGTVETLWRDLGQPGVGRDDLVDALALLWTAERWVRGEAIVLPAVAQTDNRGLRMEVVC